DLLRPGEDCLPLQGRASGSNDLPWALPRVLQAIPKINSPAGGNCRRAGPVPGGVCSKDASGAFGRDTCGSAIAASIAGRRRGYGRGGRARRDTGPRRWANRNGTVKAGATRTTAGALSELD